jgi:hypothetical protein
MDRVCFFYLGFISGRCVSGELRAHVFSMKQSVSNVDVGIADPLKVHVLIRILTFVTFRII